MTAKSSLAANVGWRIVLDVFSRGTFFLVNILIARSLGASEFGKFAYAVSLTQIFYIFTDMGLHLQLIKELGSERGKNEGRWIDFFELKLVLMAACFAVFCGLTLFFWHWEKPWLLVVALAWMFSNSLLDFNQFVCNGLGRIDVARVVMALQRFTMLAAVLVALLYFRTLEGVLIGLCVGGVAGAFLSNRYAHGVLKIPFAWKGDTKEWRRILRASIPLGVGGAFGSWYLRIGAVILAWVWTSQTVGEYAAGFRIFETTYIIPAAVMSVALPHLSSALGRGRAIFSKELGRLSAAMAAAGVCWAVFLYAGSPLLVRFLFGDRFLAAAGVLRILSAVGGLVFCNYVVTHLMVVLSFQKRHALNQILAFIVAALLCTLLIPARGAEGAAAALLGAESFLFLITAFFLYTHWDRAVPHIDYDTILDHEPS